MQTGQSVSVIPGAQTIPSCTVAQLLVQYLIAEGVTKIFGIPGGAAVWLMDELKKHADQIEFVICRHESGAAYMADGHARATGGLGVVLTTSGPGATNAVSGAMNAQASNVSLLVITGEVPEKYFGQGYLQEGTDAKLDVNVIFRNAVESSAMISSPSNFQTLFQQALRNARSLPNRAAHISLPNDVAGTCISPPPTKPTPSSYQARAACADPKALQASLHELLEARRPLLFLGNGSRAALASPERLRAFTEFVDRFGIPVMTTPDAKGIFPETHELSLRNYGMCASAWPDLYIKPLGDPDHYDALMVLGSTLGELATTTAASNPYDKALLPMQHFIQLDLDADVIGRDFPVTRGVIGEIGASLDVLLAHAHQHHHPDPAKVDERKAFIREIKRSHTAWADPAGRDSNTAPVHPAAMIRVINEHVKEGEIFIDAGNCVGWSLNCLVVDPPVRYQSALAMGPMGFGVAAVVGGKMALPDQPCLAIVGDNPVKFKNQAHAPASEGLPADEWNEHPAPQLMVNEAHRLLLQMHGVQDHPNLQPYAAAYRDWGDDPFGGGANFWPQHVESYDVGHRIIHPVSNVPVYICGEAYSHAQGWVEGALATAEEMLQSHLGLNPPPYLQAAPVDASPDSTTKVK